MASGLLELYKTAMRLYGITHARFLANGAQTPTTSPPLPPLLNLMHQSTWACMMSGTIFFNINIIGPLSKERAIKGICEIVLKNPSAKGLAVIISNTNDNDTSHARGWCTLGGTTADSGTMTEAFNSQGIATIELGNANKDEVRHIIEALASFAGYPKGYNFFAIYFAGHGKCNSILVDNNGDEFDFENEVVKLLNKELNPAVSCHVANVPLIALLIDACRGRKEPYLALRMQKTFLAPKNLMVNYSVGQNYGAADGFWTRKVAEGVREGKKSLVDILSNVRVEIKEVYKPDALPESWNPYKLNYKFAGE